MATQNIDLTDAEATQRIESYDDDKVTDELYGFGTMMVQDSVARIAKMDAKAAALAAYSGGLITLLAATRNLWMKMQHTQVVLIEIAGAILALAAAAAIASMALQKTEWFSQDEWIKADCLSSYDTLRRYHVLTMWGIVNSHHSAYRRKVTRIKCSQLLLVGAAIVLFIALL